MGSQTFCFISLVLFAHQVSLLYLFVYWSSSECQHAHWQGSVETARSTEPPFVLVATEPPLFICKLESSPFRLIIKVGWVGSNWKWTPLLCSLVTCALGNMPWNERLYHVLIIYVFFFGVKNEVNYWLIHFVLSHGAHFASSLSFVFFFALCKLSQLLWAGSRIDILKIIVCAVHKVSVFGGSQVGGDRAVKGVLGARCWRWCRQADVYSLLKCKLEAQVKMARPNEQFGR